jgi:hypothetical protein
VFGPVTKYSIAEWNGRRAGEPLRSEGGEPAWLVERADLGREYRISEICDRPPGFLKILSPKKARSREKTFCLRENSFLPRNCSILPRKDLLDPGKTLFPVELLNPLGEKTFWTAEKAFEPRNCSILSGKDLLSGLGSHSGGELTLCRGQQVFSSILRRNSGPEKSLGRGEKALAGGSGSKMAGSEL